ncbi:MAG: YtxH domain-containing protein [Sulfurimonas sp.]|uniref:YtxH domain-containing protein n=1 Tax=Sulfurimonas sp. TaxID=2022749 RepID=UPI0025E47321|nr:YtxH domain-containing protein [Sulfurimonas sp.]MCK9491250.1 YtxH domain-containing protein [Sulfurimonas sp.]
MSEQELLLLFVGVIAVCMVIITPVVVFSIVERTKTMYKLDTFIDLAQKEFSTLSKNLCVITQQSSDLLKRLANESQFLTSKASNGITKLTTASIAFNALSQFFKEKPKNKEDKMNNNNLLGFTLGAAIAGVGAYYVFKNKDEISKKINKLEESVSDEFGDLFDNAKEKLEGLVDAFQSTAEEFLHGGTVDETKEYEIKQLVKKLEKLQKEIGAFSIKG